MRRVSRLFSYQDFYLAWRSTTMACLDFWEVDSSILGWVEDALLWKPCTFCAVCFQKLCFLALFEVWRWQSTIKTKLHGRFSLFEQFWPDALGWESRKACFTHFWQKRGVDLFSLFLCDPYVKPFTIMTVVVKASQRPFIFFLIFLFFVIGSWWKPLPLGLPQPLPFFGLFILTLS